MIITDMTQELVTAMKSWLNGHKTRSKRVLQKRSGVGYQTITDLLQGERNATLETVLSILPAIFTHEEEFLFLKKNIPGFAKHFENLNISEDDTINSVDIKRAFRDEQNFVILTLASAVGTTREEVENIYSDSGVAKLELLLGSGILREINGRIRSVKEIFYHIDAETVLAMMGHFINLFDRDGLGQPGRLCRIRTDNVSDSDLQKIHDTLREAYEKTSVIASNSSGDNVFYAGLVMSVLSGKGE